MPRNKNWTELEIQQAIDLYMITAFGRIHKGNPDIISLANHIGRSPSSVTLKLANLSSLDKTLKQKGMSHASKLDKLVWEKYVDTLKTSAAKLLDNLEISPSQLLNQLNENAQSPYIPDLIAGHDLAVITTVRQGQEKFRKIILANYDNQCAATGISQKELLIAGHISKWSDDAQNRLNPHNGLLFNRLHDKAFEDGLITVDENLKILHSKYLEPASVCKLKDIEHDGFLRLPSKFSPDAELLQKHRENIFKQ